MFQFSWPRESLGIPEVRKGKTEFRQAGADSGSGSTRFRYPKFCGRRVQVLSKVLIGYDLEDGTGSFVSRSFLPDGFWASWSCAQPAVRDDAMV